jgi:predicted MarR family transcription regulator
MIGSNNIKFRSNNSRKRSSSFEDVEDVEDVEDIEDILYFIIILLIYIKELILSKHSGKNITKIIPIIL